MNFKELLAQLEEHLGYHQFPVNPAATNIKDIFESAPLHHDLITRLIRAVYVSNSCHRLTDIVRKEKTLQALTVVRQEILRSAKTDVDVYRFVDDLGAALNSIFTEDKNYVKPLTMDLKKPHTAEIIQLSAYRRQKRLKTWA